MIKSGEQLPVDKICDPIGTGAPAKYRWSIDECKEWMNHRDINPRNGRKINSTAKHGMYHDIEAAARQHGLM
ncbi:Hypothetical protein POVR1_LOCUS264 [uncultured virus]|nr:Hypothetical protein POVR1_LOCUS264 [uncultured virus]